MKERTVLIEIGAVTDAPVDAIENRMRLWRAVWPLPPSRRNDCWLVKVEQVSINVVKPPKPKPRARKKGKR